MSPSETAARLLACRAPTLIGVRHHSPACAAAMPAWLTEAAPERLFVELPAEATPWIPWLGHPEAQAPLALAADADAFWPFAEFSPEWVAVRWAVARGVPVECFDLPIARRGAFAGPGPSGLDLPDWDELVEAPAVGATPDELRAAALVYGHGLRHGGAHPRDLAREAYMRARLGDHPGARVAVVVGAFHAAALTEDASLDPLPRDGAVPEPGPAPTLALVPWRLDLLDARSGYPAGIADPGWYARVYRQLVAGMPVEDAAAEVLVEIVRGVRRSRHAAGTPDAVEALRVARDLAALRGLAAPGRAEVLEAVTLTLTQGELLGRGRVVARAMEEVLVGHRRGRLAPGTPRSGLVPHVEAVVAELRLPGPDAPAETLLRLDPLRSELDRRRHVTLWRLSALDVPYAELPPDEDRLTAPWRVRWTPGTEAALGLAGVFGVTLEQAATGALTRARPRDDGEDAPSAGARLSWLSLVAECGLVGLAAEGLASLSGEFATRARLADLVEAVQFVERVARGLVPGLPDGAGVDLPTTREALYTAAVRSLDGLGGSTDPADVAALGSLVRLATAEGRVGDGRLGLAVDVLAADGAPGIAGAAAVARMRLGRDTAEALGATMGAWIEGAGSAHRDLGDRLAGALSSLGTWLEAHPSLLDGVARPVEGLPDADFLSRLPALRHGFDALSTAARARLLEGLTERLGPAPDADADPELARLDATGRAAVEALGLWPARVPDLQTPDLRPRLAAPTAGLDPLTRWRLVLGRDPEALPTAAVRYAAALDELYGPGRGEGSRGEAGRGTRFPTAREWSEEIEALFGDGVRVEVAGRAAERGDAAALLLLDPERVPPSVELLERALSLQGGLSEEQLGLLRRLCRRVTDSLVEALAVRVRPALTGLSSPRATRRRADRLHLRRTVEANLRTARQGPEGWQLVPERVFFRARARREMDWHVVLVVDTSGSMEASVVYAAMMASILAALPAVDVRFYGFSDEVVDFSDRVTDPLALLLGVSIGGGTRIHRALRYARERVRVPTRTLLLLVTDFEEGGSPSALLAEVRALAEAGVTLLGLAALDEGARPRFSEAIAARVVAAGMPVAALSPLELARWVGERIRG